jgi:energy-coupling factor transporter ATP-binding protein EcfA2
MSEIPVIQLPLTPVKASIKSPKELIVFSKPKVGKTTLLAGLDNCLILDFEDGSDYVDALKLKVNSIEELKAIGTAIKEANYPYKYIAVDTVTALEEFCITYAELLYSKSSMGKNWFTEGKPKYGTIINMPQGAGYQWLRSAYNKSLDYIRTLAPRIILVGHVKDTILEKQGSDFNSLDLDLTGKIKRITASNSDAIGYLYRKGNQNIISFNTTDEVSCGARPEHLRNKEIVLSQINETEDGSTVITHWDKIYID